MEAIPEMPVDRLVEAKRHMAALKELGFSPEVLLQLHEARDTFDEGERTAEPLLDDASTRGW
jgi:hypothetical protein